MKERILLSKPDVGCLEESYVVEALRSGWVAPAGPEIDRFEADIKARVGVAHAVALSSGTAALHLSLLASGVGPGSIVLTSTMTFAATANAITYTGATPYFVDSDLSTGNISPELVAEALDELKQAGTPAAALVSVDLLGKAANYIELERICAMHGTLLICDAAESLGASYGGKPTGGFGAASAFSFNGNKIMTTSGGGMLVSDNRDVVERARYLSTQARLPEIHYEHVDIGFNYRMSNILAALGRGQLTRLDEMIARRREWRSRYKRAVAEIPGVEVFGGNNDSEDNCWLTSIVIEPSQAGRTAAQVHRVLDAAGIETRPLWKPMHLQPVYSAHPRTVDGSSEWLFENGLTLPSGSAMSSTEFEYVEASLVAAFSQ